MNWITDRIRRKAQTPPPVPNGIVVPLDEVTPEQFAEDRPHLMAAADRGAWTHAANVVVPSGRSYRLEEWPPR